VGAGVQEHPRRAIAAAHEQQRPAGHRAADEVARLRDFRLVADVQPQAAVHGLHLAGEQARVDEGPLVDQVAVCLWRVDDQRLRVEVRHEQALAVVVQVGSTFAGVQPAAALAAAASRRSSPSA
jgi:hypothetical protein